MTYCRLTERALRMSVNNLSFFWLLGVITIIFLLVIKTMHRERKISPPRYIVSPNCKETMTTVQFHMPETSRMIYYAKHTSGDGDNKYCLNFRKINNAWLAYIVRTPCFNDRSDNTYFTHMVYDDKTLCFLSVGARQ